jgi:hypothetical protein
MGRYQSVCDDHSLDHVGEYCSEGSILDPDGHHCSFRASPDAAFDADKPWWAAIARRVEAQTACCTAERACRMGKLDG